MPLQCSICLSTLKEPMCLPCGHIYCKSCLADHVNFHTNPGMTSTCPDCRATFNLGIPDLAYLPAKYHKYIMSAARRVYIDNAEQSALEKRLEDAERRLESKKMGEEALLTRCEGLQKALFVHKAGEAKAQKALLKSQEKSHKDEVRHRETVAQLVTKIDRMEIDNIKLAMTCEELTTKTEDLEIRIQELQDPAADERVLDSFSSGEEGLNNRGFTREYHKIMTRAIKPLPRRVIFRRTREECDSPPPNFVAPKRARMVG